ncbi:hypothetical protein TM4_95 [Mycobacterium phage TM4]|uniref:Uncharacterized protein n=1 Tax=Mycobacterium phage TM4 TaxID=88870 RepID=G9VYU2_BPMT4|nr:hypothetical protein TM4_95 [Mycobacterium phage TM4]
MTRHTGDFGPAPNRQDTQVPDDDTAKSLAAVLGYLVGRPLKLREILEALQMSKSRYYLQDRRH